MTTDNKELVERKAEFIEYARRYGGRCRDCADNFGVCEVTGMPCEPEQVSAVLSHAFDAWTYGLAHGYLSRTAPDAVREALERAENTLRILGCNEMADEMAALSLPVSTGWRDIASAPKDGTKVDLWLIPHVAYEAGNPHRRVDCRFIRGEWFHGDASLTYHWRAVAWMPLPPSPKGGEHE